MKQYEAVMKALEDNGGFATLGHLYKHALEVNGVKWGTKTPFASVRRIVQERPEIFKIKPGLWGLKKFKDEFPSEMLPDKGKKKESVKFNHSYFQGLLIEVGNLKNFDTFVPAQDKNKKYLFKQKLGELATLKELYRFGYKNFLNRAKTVDVIWFNKRKMPSCMFEVEHSTNIKNSLLKYVELQDFRIKMYIVADKVRKKEFFLTLNMEAFSPVKNLVKFLSYDDISKKHEKALRASII